jgi:predicted nucleotidyltransferase
MSILAEILSSGVRAEIFRLLFGLDPAELHLRDIVRSSGFSVGTVQTEMKKLSRLDLVLQRRDGNRLYYRANSGHPLFVEIRGLVLKTVGLVDVLRDAFAGCPEIRVAFVFGSVAAQGENARSDIDLMVIGAVSPREVSRILREPADRVSREINPYVIEVEEFNRRRGEGDHFISTVMESPKLYVIGADRDLAELGQ